MESYATNSFSFFPFCIFWFFSKIDIQWRWIFSIICTYYYIGLTIHEVFLKDYIRTGNIDASVNKRSVAKGQDIWKKIFFTMYLCSLWILNHMSLFMEKPKQTFWPTQYKYKLNLNFWNKQKIYGASSTFHKPHFCVAVNVEGDYLYESC